MAGNRAARAGTSSIGNWSSKPGEKRALIGGTCGHDDGVGKAALAGLRAAGYRGAVGDEGKTAADQVGEIRKLVQDAQDKLDQVTRALRSLESRLEQEDAGRRRD